MNELLNMAKTAATADHTKTQEAGEYTVPPAGPTPARFIGYVEVGKQPQEYEGVAKNPALECLLFFELNGPKHKRTVVVDGADKEFTNRIKVTTTVSVNSKAGFKKLFNEMRQERENITHMAQMLGEPFLITVVHNTVGEGDKARTYANMKDANGWRIGPPVFIDPLDPDNKRPVPVPEPTQPIMLMLWDNPNKMMWDSIFIDGTSTIKKDGKEVEVSKNWMQELCMKATDYENSPLYDMLTGIGGVVQQRMAEQEQKPAVEGNANAAAAGATQAATTANVGTAAAAESKPNTSAASADAPAAHTPAAADNSAAEDVLASLGLS